MSFTVNNEDLRKALEAVSAHAYAKEDLPVLATVIFDVNDRGEVLLTASNGETTGVAFLQLVDSDGMLDHFGLYLRDVAALLSVFSSGEQQIQFHHMDGELGDLYDDDSDLVRDRARLGRLEVTDVSGMIPGKQLRLRPADLRDRDVTSLWHEIAVRFHKIRTVPRRTAVNSKYLALFRKAAAVYKEPLVLDTGDTRGSLIVRCGPSFIGYLVAANLDPDVLRQYEQYREEWRDRLPTRLEAVRDGS